MPHIDFNKSKITFGAVSGNTFGRIMTTISIHGVDLKIVQQHFSGYRLFWIKSFGLDDSFRNLRKSRGTHYECKHKQDKE